MDPTPETPREAAQAPPGGPPSPNGKHPLNLDDLARELTLAVRALEEVDMRVRNVQATNMMIFGAIVLLIALQLKELRG